jgi:hypothetical protein
MALGRPPGDVERSQAAEHLRAEANPGKSLAWLLYNLDEFLHVR